MALCAHQQWLQIQQNKNGFTFQYGSRLSHIAHSLPHPAGQYPSLIFFVGKQLKAKALRLLFPGNGISRCRNHGIANVCVDPGTLHDEHPILIADNTPDHARTNLRQKTACHETINHPVTWLEDGTSSQQDLLDQIHARILSLFIDVLCIFAQDCGGLDGVAERLATLAAVSSASSLPASVRPRLLIVTSISGPDFNAEILPFRLRVLSDPRFSDSFSSLNVVNLLGSPRNSPREHFSGLRMVLRDETVTARAERISTHTLFSMVHIATFFDMALHNFATSPLDSFNFIVATRDSNPVPVNFPRHLKSFMSLALEHNLPHHILWEFVASAIVMDHFLPDMHCEYPACCQTARMLTKAEFSTHQRSSGPSIVILVFSESKNLQNVCDCLAT